jgi:hypothetical protein
MTVLYEKKKLKKICVCRHGKWALCFVKVQYRCANLTPAVQQGVNRLLPIQGLVQVTHGPKILLVLALLGSCCRARRPGRKNGNTRADGEKRTPT